MSESPETEGKRDFLKLILGGSLTVWLGSVLYPIFAFLKPPAQPEVEVSSILAGTIQEFEEANAKIVRFGRKPVIVVKLETGDLRAYEATCTHLDCTVQYRRDLGVIWCACHNGKYDMNGRVLSGPPPRPLEQFRVVQKDDDVYVTRGDES
ncbi:MAG: ubiquinol-cytochrome c reductase iron-sulfur subunit [Ignavibacteria bacterium]|nr:ubiquinol-cytochrome c reductase iron-sulfur subunit [Ignavibacteria bacterium]